MNLIEKEHIKEAVELLRSGAVLLHRADTIWGLICDATSDQAVESISVIKGRTNAKAYVVLVSSSAMLERYVKEVPEVAWELIDTAVSPLTIIYPEGRLLSGGVCAADGSIAVRIVKDPLTERLIQQLGKPLISTSANLMGQASPMRIDDVSKGILDQVGGIISDEGKSSGPHKASSIIKLGLHGEVSIIRS
ncbi:MAG: Sua5/YciO/YrdC/YwlC family protein [Bacteroidetes bacterium]|jgi:L-threonylcarbamoyladenylate synthase|nr:Sua5/YciO/YrdC/YwlC family protein [Bacteroidota bacterium]